MNCKEYIFWVSSGKLVEASSLRKIWVNKHRLICPNCRKFTKNDAHLSEILAAHKKELLDKLDPE